MTDPMSVDQLVHMLLSAGGDSEAAIEVLIVGPALADYMIDYGLGVTTRTVYEIKRIDSDWFDGE